MNKEMVYAWKTPNARVWPEATRVIPRKGFMQEKHFVRFGSAHANALLLLELGSVKKLCGFDIEWYEGLFLRRLREKLFAEADYTEPYQDSFDHVANTYQYDWVDLEAAMTIGKRRYYQLLIQTVKEIATEEGATGGIAKVALRAFRFAHDAWETA